MLKGLLGKKAKTADTTRDKFEQLLGQNADSAVIPNEEKITVESEEEKEKIIAAMADYSKGELNKLADRLGLKVPGTGTFSTDVATHDTVISAKQAEKAVQRKGLELTARNAEGSGIVVNVMDSAAEAFRERPDIQEKTEANRPHALSELEQELQRAYDHLAENAFTASNAEYQRLFDLKTAITGSQPDTKEMLEIIARTKEEALQKLQAEQQTEEEAKRLQAYQQELLEWQQKLEAEKEKETVRVMAPGIL